MKRTLSLLLSLCLLLGLCACGGSKAETDAPTWQEQYDLGIKYLSEGNYEEAIIAFELAIEIEPKRADAYAKAAEAYQAMGDLDAAIAILEQGINTAGDESLSALLEQLKGTSVEVLERIDEGDGEYSLVRYRKGERREYTLYCARYLSGETAEWMAPGEGEWWLKQEDFYVYDELDRLVERHTLAYSSRSGELNGIDSVEYNYNGIAVTIRRFERNWPDVAGVIEYAYTMAEETNSVELQHRSSGTVTQGEEEYCLYGTIHEKNQGGGIVADTEELYIPGSLLEGEGFVTGMPEGLNRYDS